MVTGKDLKHARQSRRIRKADVAQHFDIDLRTLTRWESKIPESAVPAVEAWLEALKSGPDPGPLLSDATDAQLLAQVAERLERARQVTGRGLRRGSLTRPAYDGSLYSSAEEAERAQRLGELEERESRFGHG